MRVRCPHCSQSIEFAPELESQSVVCPTCGSEVGLLSPDDPTATMPVSELPVLEHFELIEEVGMGQFGRVWKAKDEELDRLVAVKMPHKRRLSKQEAGYFLREARSAARLNHPNIVSVFEVGVVEQTMYIVSEYIDGPSMRLWKEMRKPQPEEAARVCRQIALALDYAHGEGIIHRDLKPSNVILDELGEPHIADFGLAKQEGAEATIAVTGQVIGTPAYMAPEQIRNGHRVDRRSDVYSLGVVMYELLTGKRPFSGGRRVLFQQVLYDDPPLPRSINRSVPRDLQTICLKALEKRPADRYQTAAEFAEDLERFLSGETIHARPTPTMVRAARWAKRRPAVISSVVLALLVLILTPLAFLKREHETPRGANTPSTHSRLVPEVRGPVVSIITDPPGAHVVLIPLDERSGFLAPDRAISAGTSPLRRKLEPGWYLVVAHTEDKSKFHEVYRHVPGEHEKLAGVFPFNSWRKSDEGVIELPTITLFDQQPLTQEMVHVEGGRFEMSSVGLSGPQEVDIPNFFVDATEVTYGQIEQANLGLPSSMEELKLTRDHPVVQLTWFAAATYAERMGKRLLLDAEYVYLDTAGGTQRGAEFWPARIDDTPIPVHAPNVDRLSWNRLSRPLLGIRSNVMEWTDSWMAGQHLGEHYRIIRGGLGLSASPEQAQPFRPPVRIVTLRVAKHANLGFRCARSERPRLAPSDFLIYKELPRK